MPIKVWIAAKCWQKNKVSPFFSISAAVRTDVRFRLLTLTLLLAVLLNFSSRLNINNFSTAASLLG